METFIRKYGGNKLTKGFCNYPLSVALGKLLSRRWGGIHLEWKHKTGRKRPQSSAWSLCVCLVD